MSYVDALKFRFCLFEYYLFWYCIQSFTCSALKVRQIFKPPTLGRFSFRSIDAFSCRKRHAFDTITVRLMNPTVHSEKCYIIPRTFPFWGHFHSENISRHSQYFRVCKDFDTETTPSVPPARSKLSYDCTKLPKIDVSLMFLKKTLSNEYTTTCGDQWQASTGSKRPRQANIISGDGDALRAWRHAKLMSASDAGRWPSCRPSMAPWRSLAPSFGVDVAQTVVVESRCWMRGGGRT